MNVLDLLQQQGVTTVKASGHQGGEFHGPCPGCGGTDRFHLWPAQNDGQGSYWCRQCGKAGDAIQFCRDFMGMDFKDACRHLDLPVPVGGWNPPRLQPQAKPAAPEFIPRTIDRPPAQWIEHAEKFVEWAQCQLLNSEEDLRYLDGRGIGFETVKRFRLGLNPGNKGKDLWRHRESWGLSTVLKDDGKPKRLWLPRGIVIPMIDDDGAVVRVRIRTVERRPPYYLVPGSATGYLVTRPDARGYVLTESELDAMAVAQAAGDLAGAVAIGNAQARPDDRTYQILKPAISILVALDADKAGRAASVWWRKNFPQADRWPVSRGKDPGDAVRLGVDLRAWVLAGLPPALTIGRSVLDSSTGGEAVSDTPASRPQEMVAPTLTQKADPKPRVRSIDRLYDLLRSCPVKIRFTPRRITLLEDPDWVKKNWETSKEISNLVFFDADVFAFLDAHPAPVIAGWNFWKTAAAA